MTGGISAFLGGSYSLGLFIKVDGFPTILAQNQVCITFHYIVIALKKVESESGFSSQGGD